jgi:hypothetical protein
MRRVCFATLDLAAQKLDGNPLRSGKSNEVPTPKPMPKPNFELAINLETAKTLGLTLPDRLLALADEVIE